MNKKILTIVFGWLLLGGMLAVAADGLPARPNILFIMADDHAYHAISAYTGGRLNQTPNLDRLAKEGIRFDRCFDINSICSPSRATVLTGKYSHLNGVPVFNMFDGSQPTVAKMMQAGGYYTGMIGKWHLGSEPTGFDQWCILPGQGIYNNPDFYSPTGRTVIKGYVTDIITDLGIDFLEKRPKDRPFFLMLHHKAPHRNWIPDAVHREEFARRTIPESPTLWDDYAGRTDAIHENKQTVAHDLTRRDLKLVPPGVAAADFMDEEAKENPAWKEWLSVKPDSVEIQTPSGKKTLTGHELAAWKYQRFMQDYLACIQSVDDNMGRLLDYLDRTGLATNTVIFYCSDNGFFLGDHGLFDKRFMYEESLRIPLLVRWPGVIPHGTNTTGMALNVDFAETFLDLAGLPIPADMQGHSLVPLLHGGRPGDWRDSFYYRYYHDPGDHNTRAHYGMRTDTHKLIYYWTKDQWEMYDLLNDPQEMHNLYNDPAQTNTIMALKKELYRLKAEVKDHDEFARQQPPSGVDVPPVKPGKAAPTR